MNTYVFPSAEWVLISTTIELAETTGFEVRDIESFRNIFLLTLRRWRQRLRATCRPSTAPWMSPPGDCGDSIWPAPLMVLPQAAQPLSNLVV